MNTDDRFLHLMRFLEGETANLPENTTREEVHELREILKRLKELPHEVPDLQTDARINDRITSASPGRAGRTLRYPWWSYALVAASLAILVYLVMPASLQDTYAKLETNTEKLSFIHKLYNTAQLSDTEVRWLQERIGSETNPNLKVVLLDLIESKSYPLHEKYAEWLMEEPTPVVQLALLETMGNQPGPVLRESLQKFELRKDLDPAVRSRTSDLLQNLNGKAY